MLKNYDNQYDLMSKAPINKLIISLALPTIASMLITNIYNIADTYFVSQLGTSASGAVGIVFGIMSIIQAFGFLFGHGAGSNIARMLGSKNYDSANKFASTGFACGLLVGFVLMILGIIFLNPILRVLGSSDTIFPYAKSYGLFIFISSPFMMLSLLLNNILRYEGKAKLGTIGLITGSIINIIGDPILMFGLNLGMDGAGLSTCLSQIISFIILFYMFLSHKSITRLHFKYINFKNKRLIRIISNGFPSLSRQGLASIATIFLNSSAVIYGDAAIAAMSIVARVANFIFSVGLGIGQGFQPVAAFNFGAKLYKRVKDAFFFTYITSTLLLGIFAIVGLIFSDQIIMIFRDDPQVVAIGSSALRFQCIALFFQPLSLVTNMLLQSTGQSGQATFVSTLRNGLYFLPLIIILPGLIGIRGIELAQPIADIMAFATAIPFVILFFRKFKKEPKH